MSDDFKYEPSSYQSTHREAARVWNEAPTHHASARPAPAARHRDHVDPERQSESNKDALPPEIVSQTKDGLFVLSIDGTGSTLTWPAAIFAKMPYTMGEIQTEFLGSTSEVLLGVFGDLRPRSNDAYAVRFRRPVRTAQEAREMLLELKVQFNGGGQYSENSELVAEYVLLQVKAPQATRKVLTIFTDESPYSVAEHEDAKKLGIRAKGDMRTATIFDLLKKDGWDIYIILKPYGDNTTVTDSISRQVYASWEALVGADHIAQLKEKDRMNDVLFGILAQTSGKVDYFYTELLARQVDGAGKPEIEKLIPVYDALEQINGVEAQERHPCPGRPAKGLGRGKKSAPLM